MMAQKPKPENNSAAYFEPGSAVEVRTHGGLFRGSWFSGTIISRDASDRFLQGEYHNHHNARWGTFKNYFPKWDSFERIYSRELFFTWSAWITKQTAIGNGEFAVQRPRGR